LLARPALELAARLPLQPHAVLRARSVCPSVCCTCVCGQYPGIYSSDLHPGAAGQQSNEESIEFGDEDESRDDGSPSKKVKPKVLIRSPPHLSCDCHAVADTAPDRKCTDRSKPHAGRWSRTSNTMRQ
jgi:hypothetical protein